MSDSFNIVARLQVQAGNDIRSAISGMQRQAAATPLQLGVKLDPAQAARAQSQLQGLSSTLRHLNTGASGTSSSMSRLGQSFLGITSGATQATSALTNFSSVVGLSARRFAGFALGAGTLLTAAQGLRRMVSEGVAFNREMVRFAQTGNDGAKAIRGIEDEITRLSTSLGISSKGLSHVATEMRQTGLAASEVQKVLGAIAETKLSPSFGKSLEGATQSVIVALNAFKIKAEDAKDVLGSIGQISADTAVESQELATAIQKMGGSFATLSKGKESLQEMLALFTSVQSNTREGAATVATSLRTIFQRIQRPEIIEDLKGLGIQLRDANGQFVGAYESVRRLNEGLRDLPVTDSRYAQIAEKLGGVRNIGRTQVLISSFGDAQKAMQSAQQGALNLTLSTERAMDDLSVRLARLGEEWLKLGRTIVNSEGFRAGADIFIKFGNSAAYLLDKLTPLIPLLGTLGAIKLGQNIGGIAGSFGRSLIQRHASGGVVGGVGTQDNQVSLLTPGEFVISRGAASRIGLPALTAINSGRLPRYATGGPVGLVSPSVANQLGDPALVRQVESFGIAVHSLDQVIREFVEGTGLVIRGVKEQAATLSTAKPLSPAQSDVVLNNQRLVWKVLADKGIRQGHQRYGEAESLGMEALMRAAVSHGGGAGFGGYAYASISHAIGREFKKQDKRPEVALGDLETSGGGSPLGKLMREESQKKAERLKLAFDREENQYGLRSRTGIEPPFVSRFFGAVTSSTGGRIEPFAQLPVLYGRSDYDLARPGTERNRLAGVKPFGARAGRFAEVAHGDYSILPSERDELLAEQDRLIREGIARRKQNVRGLNRLNTDPLAAKKAISDALGTYQTGGSAVDLLAAYRMHSGTLPSSAQEFYRSRINQVLGAPILGTTISPFDRFRNAATRGIANAFGTTRAGAAAFGRGLANFGLSYGAPIVATYAGEGLSGLAGSADTAVTSGHTSSYSAYRGGGGLLSGAGLGVAVGASVGGGVPGAVAGAVIGGLVGLVSSLSDAAKEIREVRIGNALTEFSDKISTLTLNGGATDYGTSTSALAKLREYRANSTTKNISEATGFFSGFDADAFQALQAKSERHSFGPQLSTITTGLQKQAEALGKANVGSDLTKLVSDLREGGGGLNRELLEIVASVRGVSVGKVLDEFRKSIESGQRTALSDRRSLDVRLTQERAVNSFGRLSLSVDSAADKLLQLTHATDTLSDLFHGTVSPVRTSLHSENLSQLGRNDSGALIPLRAIAGVGGDAGRQLLGQGTTLDTISRILPGALINAVSNPAGGDDQATAVSRELRKQVGQGEGEGADAIISVIADEISKSGEKLFEDVRVDVHGTAQKFIESAGAPIREASLHIAKELEGARATFASGLAEYRQRQHAVGQTLDARATAGLGTLRTSTFFSAYNSGNPGRALDYLSLDQLNEPYNSRLRRLSGGLTNPRDIGQALRQTRGDIDAAQARLDKANPIGKEFQDAATELTRLKGKAADLQQALEHLANSSARVSGAQEKLARLEDDRQSRLSLGERFLTADPTERSQLRRGFQYARIADRQGNLNGLTTAQRQLAIGSLRAAGSSTLTGFPGQPRANDVLTKIIEGSGFGLNGDQKSEQAELQKSVIQAMQDAEKALAELAGNQRELADTFFERLGSNQDAFLKKLADEFTKNKIAEVENKIGAVGADKKTISDLAGNKGVLNAAGIRTAAQLKALTGNRGDIEKLSAAQATTRSTLQSLSAVRQHIGEAPLPPFLLKDGNNSLSLNTYQRGDLTNPTGDLHRFLRGEGLESGQADKAVKDFLAGIDRDRGTLQQSHGDARVAGLRRLLDESVTGAVSGKLADASKDYADSRRVLGRIGGLDIGKIEDNPRTTLKALDAFAGEAGNGFETLDEKLKATTDEFDKLTAQAAALRATLAGGEGGKVAGLAGGGFVPRGTDTVPAMLSPGEFVVRAGAAQANLGLLQEINSGTQYYADGGHVRIRHPLNNYGAVGGAAYRRAILNNATTGVALTDAGRQNILAGLAADRGALITTVGAGPNPAAAGAARTRASAANLLARQYLSSASDIRGIVTGQGTADFAHQNRIMGASLASIQHHNDILSRENPAYQQYLRDTNISGRRISGAAPAPKPAGQRRWGLKQVGHFSGGGKVGYYADGGMVTGGGGNGGGTENFSASIAQLSQASESLNQAITTFSGSASALTEALNNMPRSITMQATHEVVVTHNGAQVFSQIEPAMRDLAIATFNEQMSRFVQQHLPDAGIPAV